MDIWVLDKNLEVIDILDTFNSFIWTDRYNEYGDFEIYSSVSDQIMSSLQQDYYLQIQSSEHVMIIEGKEIDTDSESGNSIIFSGRSLESILDRRIVWAQTIVEGKVQDCIKKLLDENAISPSKAERKIPNLVFEASTDPRVLEPTMKAQYTGDNLYDVIKEICDATGLGFKITLNEEKQFVFKLYLGEDRSYSQSKHPYVIFSPKFENIANSNYVESKKTLKNVALVAGEGEGAKRKMLAVGNTSGLDRRELFVDARDISSVAEDNTTIPTDEYNEQLTQRGKEKLAENTATESFEGQVEMTKMFEYGKDFFIGDIVQITNEYGMESKVIILEIVKSISTEGEKTYPTLATVI